MTEYSVEIERMVVRLENLFVEGASLEPALLDRLRILIHACDNLPAECGLSRALPVFAVEISGDPHYFDEGTMAVRFLRLFIQERYGMKCQPAYSDTEWKARILYRAGILKDDLSNTVLLYGVQAFLKDGTAHMGLD